MTFDNPFYQYLQEMADCAEDAGMHPDKINAVCDNLSACSSKAVEQPFEGLEDVGSTPTADSLSLEDRKTPTASTLAEGKWVDDENESFWKEPEWTLRDEAGESYKEIP